MNSNRIMHMSCAARFERVLTTTACVYSDNNKSRVNKNANREWRTVVHDSRIQQEHPNLPRVVYKEMSELLWKQTVNDRTIGVWKKVEEPNLNVVILGNFRPNTWNKILQNDKIKCILTNGAAFENYRLSYNASKLYQNMVVRGNWF